MVLKFVQFSFEIMNKILDRKKTQTLLHFVNIFWNEIFDKLWINKINLLLKYNSY